MRNRYPWVKGPALDILFETGNVRPGDLLWLHNSPGLGCSKMVLVVESRMPVRLDMPEIYIPEYEGNDRNMYLRPAFRGVQRNHVKAWCRPPLDIEL